MATSRQFFQGARVAVSQCIDFFAAHKLQETDPQEPILRTWREASLPTYLAWTDADLANIERALKRYRTMGLEATFESERARDGVLTLSQVDPRFADSPIITFEIHKFARSDHPERLHWVVQLQSIGGRDNRQKQHGCISAASLVFAIAKAELDAQKGFPSTDTFDMAANSYWLK